MSQGEWNKHPVKTEFSRANVLLEGVPFTPSDTPTLAVLVIDRESRDSSYLVHGTCNKSNSNCKSHLRAVVECSISNI